MSAGRLSLDTLEVASPCAVPWESMSGTERVRFCPDCRLQVYNLSGMSRNEAEAFLRGRDGGRTCVRFFRRQDGTVLTQDCPRGLQALRRVSVSAIVTLAACVAFLLALVGLGGAVSLRALQGWLGAPLRAIGGPGAGAPGGTVVMGDPICPPPAVSPQQPRGEGKAPPEVAPDAKNR
jgi:hypothetical protein